MVFDKLISSQDLQRVLEKYFEIKQSRDLCGLLKNLEDNLSWKGAPRFPVMIQYVDLYSLFFELLPNTVISDVKLKHAIEACHAKMPCIMSSLVFKLALNRVSQSLRIGAAKWREIANSVDQKRLFLGKVINPIYKT